MFVPVACSECGKPFQVPETAVGNPTACPWCQATVLALPIATAAPAPPVAQRAQTPPARQEEFLPLEDEPVASRTRRRFPLWIIPVAVLLLLVVGTITVGILRHKQGHFTSMEWRPVTAPVLSALRVA